MTPLTLRQAIEDHILMAHAYADNMGDTVALDAAEATIRERRGEVIPGYTSQLRERVVFLFIAAQGRDLGEHVRMARDLEAHLWQKLRELEQTAENRHHTPRSSVPESSNPPM